MRFNSFINEDTNDKQRWNDYLSSNSMLKSAVKVLNDINKKGYKAYIVGGSVRDFILGKEPHDVDIATNCPIDTLSKMYKTYDIGKSKDFGIVTVNVGGHQYEIAQFRQDGTYSDGRRPDSVKICTDFQGDAARRDFCFNAMGVDAEGNIIDYFDGRKDIKNKVVQTVGNPHDRFQEDYLRMMRAARFAGKLGFDIGTKTKEAMKQHAEKLKGLAPERIKDELFKMASQSGSKFADTLQILDEVGVLNVILPELMKLKDFQEMEIYHPEAYEGGGKGTPFDHTLAALRVNKIEDPLVNLAILFHDIGKTTTYAVEDGKHTFHGHAGEAKDIIDELAKRLKLSNKEKDAIIFAAVNHMKMHTALDMKPSKIIKLVNDENWEVLKAVSYADDAARKGLFDQQRFDNIINTMIEIRNKWGDKITGSTVKVIDGKRVMQLTGLPPSKTIGEIIKKVTDEVLNKGIKNDREIDSLVLKYYQEMK